MNGLSIRDEDDKEARARRVVRNNNFTQQTNALDVDKHMSVPNYSSIFRVETYYLFRMAYIEENLKIRSRPLEPADDKASIPDPQEELYRVSERWKSDKKVADEGSVTNSLAMLTAIPEVDLGMECVFSATMHKIGTDINLSITVHG
jgi:hypothetical protein